MALTRLTIAMASAATLLAPALSPAAAQSSVCVQLEARLVALERGTGPGSVEDAREYDRAIGRQQQEIDRATAEARRSRCLGGFLFQPANPAPKCGELMATIDRMKANLRRLMQARPRTGQMSVARERNEVLRSMNAYGCGTGQPGAAPRATGLFAALFGPARIRGMNDDRFFRGQGFGTFRTLCVRTCDGYYFPISFSTVPGQFATDEQTCRAMCPGVDVALYTYRNPGEDADAMRSLLGEPYSALPAAFRYREEYDPACKCGSPVALNAATIGAAFDLSAGALPEPLVALPKLRPAQGEDPETLANRAGGFVVAKLPPAAEAGTDPEDGENRPLRQVRVVGPAFYYGQEPSALSDLTPVDRPSLRTEDDE